MKWIEDANDSDYSYVTEDENTFAYGWIMKRRNGYTAFVATPKTEGNGFATKEEAMEWVAIQYVAWKLS